MRKTTLITGATSGFGLSTAILLAKHGYRLIISGRRNDRLEEIKRQIIQLGSECITLCFDIRDQKEVAKQIESLPEDWRDIDILINNAGLAAGKEKIQDGLLLNWERMIDTNIKGLLYMTQAVLPAMVEKNSGHIINIGSTAGREAYEGGNIYCATKHAVDALSKSMRIDLLKHKIKVSQVRPGLAETEFSKVRFDGDEQEASKVYQNLNPLVGDDIADAIFYILTRPLHVCINDLEITCTAQANSTMVYRD